MLKFAYYKPSLFLAFFLFISSTLLGYEILTDEDVILLKEKIAKDPSPWMQKQIKSDLRAFYEKGISQEMLNFTFLEVPGGPKSQPICRRKSLSG